MTFRLAARYVLLTYPQCGTLDPFKIVDLLGGLGAECIIGREDHSDGGIHLHAFVDFGRKFQSRNQRIFDVDGRHPNILRGTKTPGKMWDYATKDGDIVAGGLERPSGEGISPSGSAWSEIILAENRDEFFERVAQMDPRALCVNFASLRAYAEWKYRPTRDPYQNPAGLVFDTSEYPELDEWARRALDTTQTGKFFTTRSRYGRLPLPAPCSILPERIARTLAAGQVQG
ncbi:rep protein [Genomoviridae sp.]|nr:rep protein [Genomoviridae sp.]